MVHQVRLLMPRLCGVVFALAGVLLVPALSQVTVTQEFMVSGSSPGWADGFASDVAISGDTCALIDGQDGAGDRVLVFRDGVTGWQQEAQLDVPDLGGCLALDGDTLVVSSEYADATGPDSGAVEVWVRVGGSWVVEQLITAPAKVSRFGSSLAVDGDTLVVGSRPKASGGLAHVFVRVAGVWMEQAQLLPATPAFVSRTTFGSGFGAALAVDGDTVAVGSRRISDGLQSGGVAAHGFGPAEPLVDAKVFIFERQGSDWIETARFAERHDDSLFGDALALSGDVLAVSDYPWSVDVFERSSGQWARTDRLKVGSTPPTYQLGRDLDVDGDVIVVSGMGSPTQSLGGIVGVWQRGVSGWDQVAWFEPDDAGFMRFGASLELSGERVIANVPALSHGGAAWVHGIHGL